MIRKINQIIRQPFWSAGQKYGWEGSRTGIGLNVLYFKEMDDKDCLEVPITISGVTNLYQIQKSKAKELVKQYRCWFVAKDGTRLIVLPLQDFVLVGNEKLSTQDQEVVWKTRLDKIEEVDNKQDKLI